MLDPSPLSDEYIELGTEDGETPAILAARYGYVGILTILVEAGASLSKMVSQDRLVG